ncbi:MAG: hypothetical protein ABII22_05880 [Candidatus Micrarchaeota archaeon]
MLAFIAIFDSSETTSECSENYFDNPPLPAFKNCGPEERYEFDVAINSKQGFVDFLKNKRVSNWLDFEEFRNAKGQMDWNAVKEATSVCMMEYSDFTVYSLDFVPYGCSPESKFTARMSNEGDFSLYGCCGK